MLGVAKGIDLDDLSPEEIGELEIPESEGADDAVDRGAGDDPTLADDDGEALAEAWIGDTEELADGLIALIGQR